MQVSMKRWSKRRLSAFLQAVFAWKSESLSPSLSAKRVLVLAPHPDDETLGCGGALLRLQAKGAHVRVMFLTGGEASSPSEIFTPEQLAATRRKEALGAARLLGIEEASVVFRSYPDGGGDAFIEPMAKDIAAQVRHMNPDLIFSPYEKDGHEDHRAVAKAVRKLQDSSNIKCRVLAYPMWFWPKQALWHLLFFRGASYKLDAEPYLETKRRAMSAYRSQNEKITGECGWHVLEDDFVRQNFYAFEFFFEMTST